VFDDILMKVVGKERFKLRQIFELELRKFFDLVH
jgi:hypothetical protein